MVNLKLSKRLGPIEMQTLCPAIRKEKGRRHFQTTEDLQRDIYSDLCWGTALVFHFLCMAQS